MSDVAGLEFVVPRTFERLLTLDMDVRLTFAQVAFGQSEKEPLLEMRRQKFYAALDALTPDEVVAFREFRKSVRGEGE